MENNKENQELETKKSKPTKKDKLHLLEESVNEFKDKYLRAVAELENFKKRTQNERIIERKYAASSFISEILNPYEQLSIIVEHPTDNELLKNYLIGFKMIKDQLAQILEREGVKEIDALNQQFNPQYHHALEREDNKELPSGIITKVLQKGYIYKDRILRPAMVKVNEWSE